MGAVAARHLRRGPHSQQTSPARVNPEALGWTKRLRLDSAPPDRTPCASRMSALETSFRKFAEEPTKSVVRPELGLNFDSLGGAYNFYNLYSREIGFGIRYGKSMLNAEMTKSMQEIVCGCSVRCSSSFVAVYGSVGSSLGNILADWLGFEDRQGNILAGGLPGNGKVTILANGGADCEMGPTQSVSVNVLVGLAPPDKQRGAGRPTNS
ncbi:uncharacterized protein [Triticum aestivum]|uniref:uncharacterized protein n=1 Tax=Triticum aestivum TaxID=4565 RepID=UPI001D01C4F6|nr:uncharacterized protein LOC123117186 [Triticum aestivum]